jgi:tetratricopeptide (TPR) repeat protein
LTIKRKIGDRDGEGKALSKLGAVYFSLDQYKKAIEFSLKGLAIAKEIGDRSSISDNLNNIGNSLNAQKQPILAVVFLKEAVNEIEAIRKDLQKLPIEQQKSYAETVKDRYRLLADLLLQQDRVLEAQRVLDLLKVQELDDFLRGVMPIQ